MGNFCHLHVHTKYSLLDGTPKIEELIKTAKEKGQDAIAITDHGNMFGAIEFYKCAKKEGIKPVIGCEVYMSEKSRFNKVSTDINYHLILLAKNNKGYQNLIKLVSLAYTEGFYYKPRIDFELLNKYHEGIICLSACLSGLLQRQLLTDNIKEAENTVKKFKDIFKEDYYIELQDHNLREQKKIIKKQIELAKKFDVPLVATNDVHYINKEEHIYQEILMCIKTQQSINDENHMKFPTNEFYLKSEDEMRDVFSYIPEAIDNTEKIAGMCNVEFTFNDYHLPEFKREDKSISSEEYLLNLCLKGMEKRYNNYDNKERLMYELKTINEMGFTDYFLIVWDFINYAKRNKIPVGPGRGSAAGSIVSYCLEITDIDPIKYNLIFERFLNKERVTMPDIDVDFCYERRSEVIDYVIRKYGEDKVSQIVTFGTLGAKQAIRDVTKALDYPYKKGDEIAKLIPGGVRVTINDALKESKELKELYDSDSDTKKIIDISLKIEGLPRHCSTHAAGVVITNKPIMEYVPLYKGDNTVCTQYTMTTIEELGLLKMDFLGLRNLTVINDTVKMVNKNNPGFKIEDIDYEDQKVFALFKKGDTDGVFQFESPGMRRFIREFKPESIEDLILAVSIYRPGPMQEIPKLLYNKTHPKDIKYEDESLKEILSVTYGCIVYQEQVMEIFRKLAGYTLGRADIVRRAMSKKKIDVLMKEKEIFIEGCSKNNIPENVSGSIFKKIEEFAKYAFNKSHAASYSYVAYQTAYLKCHYNVYFMAALISSFSENQNKVIAYIKSCENMGIKVLPPSLNKSSERFSVIDNSIVFGLSAIKNVGVTFAGSIVKERTLKGDFLSFDDFIMRMCLNDINKRAVESLIKAGAFDEFGSRLLFLKNYEETIDYYLNQKRTNVPGQMNLFDDVTVREKPSDCYATKKDMDENKEKICLKMEKEVLGMYLSYHPLNKYKDIIKEVASTYSYIILSSSYEESGIKDKDEVTVVGIIRDKHIRTTKKGFKMATFTLDDLYGSINVIVFPKTYDNYNSLIYEDNTVVLKCNVMLNDDEMPQLSLISIAPFNMENVEKKLYLKLDDKRKLKSVKEIVKKYKGKTPLYVYFSKEKKNTLANRSLWVMLGGELIRELKDLLGEDNVKIV